MAGERNLGRGRTVRTRRAYTPNRYDLDYTGPSTKEGRAYRYKPVKGKPGTAKKAATATPRAKTTVPRVTRARNATANLGRAANFTTPRGSRGGAKWHGK